MPLDRSILANTRTNLLHAALCVAALLWSVSVHADGPPYVGQPVDAVLRELGAQGLKLVYSSETVPGSLRVQREPSGRTPVEVLEQVLAEHGLRATRVGENTYAVIRSRDEPAAATGPAPAARDQPALEEIVIAASRYSLASSVPEVHTFLTQDEIENLPRLGDDSLKAVQRLPGAATNGLSGLANMRGGEENETLVVFDGLPLYEPFHLRLLLSPTSVIDPRVLSSLDVHAGGFTAQFGDRMSSIIEVESVRPEADAYYELGLSLFHANALAAQRFAAGRGQWLAAARRSNLDEVADLVDAEIGEPSYSDAFARLDYVFTDATRGSLHMLVSADRADVQNDDRHETATATYRNSYFWGTLEHDFTAATSARAIVSYTDVAGHREGEVDDPGNVVGEADDERHYDVFGLKVDGSHRTERWLHRFGLEWRTMAADYDYRSRSLFYPGYPAPQSPGGEVERDETLAPSGSHVAAYVTSRMLVTDRLAAEVGLRWDEQTYGVDADDQWGPRVNLAYELGDVTRLRASWGRYQQFQGINELQVEDGVSEFFPAQKADHTILGVERDLPQGYALRMEAYRKDYSQLRPRYENLFDPLSLVPELRWDRVRIAPESARAEGVELLLSRRSASPWNGWASYTWSRVRDRIDGVDTPRSWDQTHAVSAGLTWTASPWSATLAATYHTGWPTTPVVLVDTNAASAEIVLGERNSLRYDYFGSLDARVSRDIRVSRGELTVFAEVSNLVDRDNECCVDYSYEYRGDSVVLERDYRHWLPIVPSIGVLWRY